MRHNSLLTANLFIVILTSLMLFGCGGGGSDQTPPPAKVANGITLSGIDASADFIEGQTRQILARLDFDDGSSEALDAQGVTWSSSNIGVATISPQGLLTAVSAGNTVIEAASSGQTETLEIVVVGRNVVALRFDPESVTLPVGTSSNVRIFGVYNDQSQEPLGADDLEILASSNETVFTVDDTQFGRVVGESVGTASLIARTATGVETSIPVQVAPATIVSLLLSADELVRPAGLLINASALGTFTDGTQRDVTTNVAWSATGIEGAQVSSTGVVSSPAAGGLVLTATSNNVTATLQLTFSAAILQSTAIQSGDGEVPIGRTLPLELRGTFSDGTTAPITDATWSVENPAVITIEQDGRVTGIGLGNSQVSAVTGELIATADIQVTPAVLDLLTITFNALPNGSLPVGLQTQASATGRFSDGRTENFSDEVIWSFSPPAVGSISATGMVTALAPGSGTVNASFQGLEAQAALEITPAVLESVQIRTESLVGSQVTRAAGLSEPIQLIGFFSDGEELALPTSGITWVVGDASIATVTVNGELQFLAVGTTTLEGRYENLSDMITVITSEAIPLALVMAPLPIQIYEATEEEIAATAFFSDNSQLNVTGTATWTSSDSGVASILQGGGAPTRLRGISRGTADVMAAITLDGVSLSDSALVTVLPSVLVLECFSDGFFDSGWRRCGSSDGGLVTSANSSLSVLPRPEWFTIAEFRFTAEGRDWLVGDVLAVNANAAVDVRIVGIENGTVIPVGETVDFELQIQATNNATVTNNLAIDVVGNTGAPVRIITGTYTIRTN